MSPSLTTTGTHLNVVRSPKPVRHPARKRLGSRKPRTRSERGMAVVASLRILRHSVLEKEILDPEGSVLLDVRSVGIARPDDRTENHAVVDDIFCRHPVHLDLWPEAAARLSTGPWAWLDTADGAAYHVPEPLHEWVEGILSDRGPWQTHHVQFSIDAEGRFRAPVEMILPEYLEGPR